MLSVEKVKTLNNLHLSTSDVFIDFDTTLNKKVSDYIYNDKASVKTSLKLKESLLYKYDDCLNISEAEEAENALMTNIILEKVSYSTKISVADKTNQIEQKEFCFNDCVNIKTNSNIVEKIPFLQKDYTSIKSDYKLCYSTGENKYVATGIVEDNCFKWFLNYDFQNERDVNIKYISEAVTNHSILSSTKDVNLIYAKSNLITEGKKIKINLLPICLDGTPISGIQVDLNQNFINPIQKKFNFNPSKISGNKYIISGNTIKSYSEDSYIRGIISFPESVYIRNISNNGKYCLPSFRDSIFFKETIKGKYLPYRYDNCNYELTNHIIYNSISCVDYIYEIIGTGNYRNIIVTIDNEYMTNYGNYVSLSENNISYRYDGYVGWNNSSKQGIYQKIISDIYGEIDSNEESHEWGIGESDGNVLYSVDKLSWFSYSRGLIGRKLYWKCENQLSYLIVWKNNNKEIVYDTTGKLNLSIESFGGICFEKDKNLEISIDDNDFVKIYNGDEISGKSFKKISWKYEGSKLIFVKDLSESIEIESDDIDNQGVHCGRIGIYTNEYCRHNFYRLLGTNDEYIESITTNPLFSWESGEDLFSVDFREIEEDYFSNSVSNEVNYSLEKIGTYEYEHKIDSNGVDISDIGFLEYREYVGNENIVIKNGEIVDIYLYDLNGKEFVLTYTIKEIDKDYVSVKFTGGDKINWSDSKAVVLYRVNKWSETRFRADLEKYDINVTEDNNIVLNTVSEPLKAYLYNSNNEEIQLPIIIFENSITIDLKISENEIYNDLKKVVVLVKGDIDSNGLICEKFDYLQEERKSYFNPVVSIYSNKFLPNKIDFNTKSIVTIFPFNVKNTFNYVISEEYEETCFPMMLNKVLIDSTREFNSRKNNFKTFICNSDDLRHWSEWKEFNEDFDLCEYGKFFKLRINVFAIEKSNNSITDIIFNFDNSYFVKRNNYDKKIYFSPSEELKKDKLYLLRVKSFNGINFSEWSQSECYLTSGEDLRECANELVVSEIKNRQVKNIEFNWNGTQNILSYDNQTIISDSVPLSQNGNDLIKGKDYFWKVNDTRSKNSKSNFSMNIKPPAPTID